MTLLSFAEMISYQEIQDWFPEADQGQLAKSLQTTIKKLALDKEEAKWNEKLQSLQVQSKFTNIVALEELATCCNLVTPRCSP